MCWFDAFLNIAVFKKSFFIKNWEIWDLLPCFFYKQSRITESETLAKWSPSLLAQSAKNREFCKEEKTFSRSFEIDLNNLLTLNIIIVNIGILFTMVLAIEWWFRCLYTNILPKRHHTTCCWILKLLTTALRVLWTTVNNDTRWKICYITRIYCDIFISLSSIIFT